MKVVSGAIKTTNFLCRNGWHKFRPRYTEHMNPNMKSYKDNGFEGNVYAFREYMKKMRSMFYYKEYLYDICERCGEIREAK